VRYNFRPMFFFKQAKLNLFPAKGMSAINLSTPKMTIYSVLIRVIYFYLFFFFASLMCSLCSVKWAPIVPDDTVSAVWLRRLLKTWLKLQAICNCRLHVHSVSTCTCDEWHLFCGSTRSAFLCVLCTKCIKWKHRWEVLAVLPVLPHALLS
jgi:hypothetical protein